MARVFQAFPTESGHGATLSRHKSGTFRHLPTVRRKHSMPSNQSSLYYFPFCNRLGVWRDTVTGSDSSLGPQLCDWQRFRVIATANTVSYWLTILEIWLRIWNRVLKPVFENSKCREPIRIMRTGKDQKTKVHNGIQNGFKFQFISPNSRGEITI